MGQEADRKRLDQWQVAFEGRTQWDVAAEAPTQKSRNTGSSLGVATRTDTKSQQPLAGNRSTSYGTGAWSVSLGVKTITKGTTRHVRSHSSLQSDTSSHASVSQTSRPSPSDSSNPSPSESVLSPPRAHSPPPPSNEPRSPLSKLSLSPPSKESLSTPVVASPPLRWCDAIWHQSGWTTTEGKTMVGSTTVGSATAGPETVAPTTVGRTTMGLWCFSQKLDPLHPLHRHAPPAEPMKQRLCIGC